jgi:hypothetical protein
LEEISALRDDLAKAIVKLPATLRDPVSVIVARAAKVTAQLELRELVPDLLAAYDRLFKDAAKKDPQCSGKTALAQALKQLGYSEAAPFLRGGRHIQMEAVWGGQEDTAQTLRGTCVLALSQCSDIPRGEILLHTVDALADRFAVVRSDAVRALLSLGGFECGLLLRLKCHVGDADSRITGEVMEALIAIDGEPGVAFVAEFLDHANEDVQDEAALALGASRRPSAIQVLIDRWRAGRKQNTVLLRALGIARDEQANQLLLEVIRRGEARNAKAAREALEAQGQNPQLLAAIEAAWRERDGEDT